MGRKVIAIWLSLIMMVSVVVIVDVSMDISLNVRGATTLYVNTTGSGGAYTKIQDAINASIDGDTVFVYNGTYYENIQVSKKINLTGEDRDNTIVDAQGVDDVVRINIDRMNISGFTLRNSGSGPFPNQDAGIFLYGGAEYCTIYNNKVSSNKNGIRLYRYGRNKIYNNNLSSNNFGIYLDESDYNDIAGNNIYSGSASGIIIVQSVVNNITGNRIFSNSQFGIYLHSSANSNNISGNDIYNNRDGIYLRGVSNNYMYNNNISNHDGYGIYFQGSSNFQIKNNNFTNDGIFIFDSGKSSFISHTITSDNIVNGKQLLFYKNSMDFEINGTQMGQLILANCTNVVINNININNTDCAVEIAHSINITVNNSYLCSNDYCGIYVYKASSHIKNNHLEYNDDFGIALYYSSDNTFEGNDVFWNSRNGFYIYSSQNNNITENNIGHNRYGIQLYSSSNYNYIARNIIDYNQYGVHLESSPRENIITDNTVISNIRGIYISPGYDNLIYHNRMIENSVAQAYDSTNDGNKWDNGYPSGGNYWNDYTDVDDYKGPNQDILGCDYIWDHNYSIDSNSFDHYPLVEPYYENAVTLHPGWNLISIPYIQSDTFIGAVLESLKGSYDAVQSYDVTDFMDNWKHLNTKKASHLNDLDRIDHTVGFWIHIIESSELLFEYPGTPPTVNQTLTLYEGWNLIGYPSLTRYNLTKGLNNITFAQEIDSIWTHNAATQKWKELTASDFFEIGKGYWIHANVECEWEVPL
ncbi:MAG: right-handed parallel beta-helix repeat-containing protein [Thermoplasmata archaeon]|nr:MAG: right-handed parallel beta-helix repeat-containing protein [Thermoplasmata archaeon]